MWTQLDWTRSTQADFAIVIFAGGFGLLLELAVSSEPIREQIEINEVAVKFGAIDAGEKRLPAYPDTAAAAHASAVNHDGVQRHDCLDAQRLSEIDYGAHHWDGTHGIHNINAAFGENLF